MLILGKFRYHWYEHYFGIVHSSWRQVFRMFVSHLLSHNMFRLSGKASRYPSHPSLPLLSTHIPVEVSIACACLPIWVASVALPHPSWLLLSIEMLWILLAVKLWSYLSSPGIPHTQLLIQYIPLSTTARDSHCPLNRVQFSVGQQLPAPVCLLSHVVDFLVRPYNEGSCPLCFSSYGLHFSASMILFFHLNIPSSPVLQTYLTHCLRHKATLTSALLLSWPRALLPQEWSVCHPSGCPHSHLSDAPCPFLLRVPSEISHDLLHLESGPSDPLPNRWGRSYVWTLCSDQNHLFSSLETLGGTHAASSVHSLPPA